MSQLFDFGKFPNTAMPHLYLITWLVSLLCCVLL